MVLRKQTWLSYSRVSPQGPTLVFHPRLPPHGPTRGSHHKLPPQGSIPVYYPSVPPQSPTSVSHRRFLPRVLPQGPTPGSRSYFSGMPENNEQMITSHLMCVKLFYDKSIMFERKKQYQKNLGKTCYITRPFRYSKI